MDGETETFYDLILLNQTDLAYLVCNDTGDEEWIPKSQVINIEFGENIEVEERAAKAIIKMEVPEWLGDRLCL